METTPTNSNKRLVSDMDFSPRPNGISNSLFPNAVVSPDINDAELDIFGPDQSLSNSGESPVEALKTTNGSSNDPETDRASVPSISGISLNSSPNSNNHGNENIPSPDKGDFLFHVSNSSSDIDLTPQTSEDDTLQKFSLNSLSKQANTPPYVHDPIVHSERVEQIKNKLEKNLVVGEVWYVVSSLFFEKFLEGDEHVASYFGNGDIVDESGQVLREKPIQVVPLEVWNLLVSWYATDDTIPIPRKVVMMEDKILVDIYLYKLTIKSFTLLSSLPYEVTTLVSRTDALSILMKEAAQKFELPEDPDRIRFWLVDNESKLISRLGKTEITSIIFKRLEKTLLNLSEGTIGDSDIQPDSTLIAEIKTITGESIPWPSEKVVAPPPLAPRTQYQPPKPIRQPGKVGLNNLGNTCYMNSGLQCVMHVPELAKYFLCKYISHVSFLVSNLLAGFYKKELNIDNPIGNGGQVARTFADLLDHTFGTKQDGTTFAPRQFKATIGRCNRIFAGYQQQDSQEFIAFLLDGLHEDLNRIHQKPSTQKPELKDDTVNDEVVMQLAEESWKTYKLRNESVILDLFGGLYMSTIICPVCSLTSITFDPFMDLTLPLPSSQVWSKDIFVFPRIGKPCLLSVELTPSSNGDHLKEYISKKLGVHAPALHMVEIYQTAFCRNIEKLGSVNEISGEANDDIVAIYEADFDLTDHKEENQFLVPVYFQNAADVGTVVKPMGIPFYISLSESDARDPSKIAQKVLAKCSQIKNGTEAVADSIDVNDLGFSMSTYAGNGDRPACAWRIYTSRLQPLIPPVIEILPDNDDSGSMNVDSWRSSISNSARSDEESPSVPVEAPSAEAELPDESRREHEDDTNVLASFEESVESPKTPLPHSPALSDFSDKFEGFGPLLDTEEDSAPMSLLDAPPRYSPGRSNGQLLGEFDTLICTWDPARYEKMFGSEDIASNISHHPDPELEEIRRQRAQKHSHGITLDDCLDTFSKTEVLSEADAWYCSRCKTHRRATKTIELWKTPDIFTIHLKRFSSYHGFRDKLADVVQFPITGLDLITRIHKSSDKTIEKDGLIYDLFAVDNHYGGLGGGHYTAYAKNFVDDKWYYFDDSRVTEADPEDSITGAAYLLFYRRRSEKPLGGEVLQEILAQIEQQRDETEEIFDIEVENDANPFQGEGRVLGTGESNASGSMPWESAKLNLSDIDESEDEAREMDLVDAEERAESDNSDFSISSI